MDITKFVQWGHFTSILELLDIENEISHYKSITGKNPDKLVIDYSNLNLFGIDVEFVKKENENGI